MSNTFANFVNNAIYLTPPRFREEFNRAWDLMTQRFFKFESLQYYDEGADGPYHDFVRGDYDAFVDKVVSLRRQDEPYFKEARARGTSFMRVHAITRPLTPYLQYECYSYVISELLGETVLTVDLDDVQRLRANALPDFLLFDDKVLFVQQYANGTLTGAHMTTGRSEIQSALEMADGLVAAASPFRNDFAPDPKLISRLVQQFKAS